MCNEKNATVNNLEVSKLPRWLAAHARANRFADVKLVISGVNRNRRVNRPEEDFYYLFFELIETCN